MLRIPFVVILLHLFIPSKCSVAANDDVNIEGKRRTTTTVCSNATHLQERINSSIDLKTGEINQPILERLRGTIDDVITIDEALFLTSNIQPSHFSLSNQGGYDNEVTAPVAYSGLSIQDLASGQTLSTLEDYNKYLQIREKVRSKTEQLLQLCPNTIQVHFTHISQKLIGGTHGPHADNCFFTIQNLDNGKSLAKCTTATRTQQQQKQKHPYQNRIAASIVYLNDQSTGQYEGGEFYWANLESGEPSIIVKPKIGRMTYFTAGIENLHGALPVLPLPPPPSSSGGDSIDSNSCSNEEVSSSTSTSTSCNLIPRRLALAMWYVANDDPTAETIPQFGSISTGDDINDDDDDPKNASSPGTTKVLVLPVKFVKSSLRVALSFELLGLQNQPTKGSWKLITNDDIPLGMLFKDNTAMLSIRIKDKENSSSIIFERHEDVGITSTKPSLIYRLQESVLIHNILDILQSLAFENDDDEDDNNKMIKEEDRLLKLKDDNAIDDARTKLPARPAR